ncbi:hypothetical protein K466DRAFT_570001 [Polyporus arcularius HHB13444]|uniref:Uncharacterized protein n=1 Tax=Polyporus arcularius HHB13444 TaxID=1314778 RepID=A0A5C3NRI4_9APHY|nr:hypothetical protein K466DRAFT_570001 [Polyporus arcularius HHB13444]
MIDTSQIGNFTRYWDLGRVCRNGQSIAFHPILGLVWNTELKVQWTTRDETWVPYRDVKHLQVLSESFEALVVCVERDIQQLNYSPYVGSMTLWVAPLTFHLGTGVSRVFDGNLDKPLFVKAHTWETLQWATGKSFECHSSSPRFLNTSTTAAALSSAYANGATTAAVAPQPSELESTCVGEKAQAVYSAISCTGVVGLIHKPWRADVRVPVLRFPL